MHLKPSCEMRGHFRRCAALGLALLIWDVPSPVRASPGCVSQLQLTATPPIAPILPGSTILVGVCVTNTGAVTIRDVALGLTPQPISSVPDPLSGRLRPGEGVCLNLNYLVGVDVCTLDLWLQAVWRVCW